MLVDWILDTGLGVVSFNGGCDHGVVRGEELIISIPTVEGTDDGGILLSAGLFLDEVVVKMALDQSRLDVLGSFAIGRGALSVSHLSGELGSEDHSVSGGELVPE